MRGCTYQRCQNKKSEIKRGVEGKPIDRVTVGERGKKKDGKKDGQGEGKRKGRRTNHYARNREELPSCSEGVLNRKSIGWRERRNG